LTLVRSIFKVVTVRGVGPSNRSFQVDFEAPQLAEVTPGVYEEAERGGRFSAQVAPGLRVSLSGTSCVEPVGRFVILEIDLVSQPPKLAANLIHHCKGSNALLVAELRINSTEPFGSQVTEADTLPDLIAFTPRAQVRPGARIVSGPTYIYGVNAPVPLSIQGGEYSINDGPYTSSPGFANQLDAVRVRLVASSVPGGSKETTLDAGGRSATFSVTSHALGTSTNALEIRSPPGDALGRGESRTYLGPPHTFRADLKADNDVHVKAWTDDGDWEIDMLAPSGAVLQRGVYEWALRYPFQGSVAPGLSVIGRGRGCNSSYGRFVVHEIVYSGNGIERVAADFEQHCETPDAPPLKGQIRYNSLVPLSTMLVITPYGDFDGDGSDDIVWRHSDGRITTWLMNGTSANSSAELLGSGTGWNLSRLADMDGDGSLDILWQHIDGRVAAYLMDRTAPSVATQLLNAGSGWSVSHTADFDGDGKADLLFRNTDGSVALWLMEGTAVKSGVTLIGPGTDWRVKAAADFDGDGKADLLWVSTFDQAVVWLMDGNSIKDMAQIYDGAEPWRVSQVADLDGNGRADIVWQRFDGGIALWMMDGTTRLRSAQILGPITGWSVARTADFDGDGKVDLLFTNTDGRSAIWLMDGLEAVSRAEILGPGGGWSVASVQDLDGDGKADIVWQNTDQRVAVWLMDGTAVAAGSDVLEAGSGWSVVP
jgi:hypothetical protein